MEVVSRLSGMFQHSGALFIAIALLLGVSSFLSSRSKQSRLRKLGSQALIVPYKLPWGLDSAYSTVFHIMNNTFVEWSSGLLENRGRTVELNLGGNRFILTDDCDNVKAVMSRQFSDFGKGEFMPKIFTNVLGDSISTVDGQIWIDIKNQMRPFIAKIRPTDFEVTEKHVRAFLKHLDNAGKTVEVFDLVDRLQLDVATEVWFGESALSLEAAKSPFNDALDVLFEVNTARLLAGRIALLFSDRLIVPNAVKTLEQYMDAQIDRTLTISREELEKREGPLTLMESLALKSSDRKYIRNQLVSVIFAGKGPVALALTWALYELARNPYIARRLREEVVKICGLENPPTANELKQMSFLKDIIRETLRLYPPLGFNAREARIDTTLPTGGGPQGNEPVAVLKGQQVGLSIISLQRRRDIVGPDSDQWRPDRFSTWTPKTWEFAPFNHGPRTCMGRAFGEFQMEYVLARIFQHFERIHWDEKRVQQIRVAASIRNAYPVRCSFHKASA